MKTLSTLLVLCILGLCTYGQKTEINLNAYSAFFSFQGNGTAGTSYINSDQNATPINSTFNVYGNKAGFSYLGELQVQRVTKRKMIYGLAIAFEQLNSKVNIDSLFLITYGKEHSASGRTLLKNSFITLNPFIGGRFVYGKITMDFLAGLDIAFCCKSEEHAKVALFNDYEKFENRKAKPPVDYRPRVQIKAQYKKAGLLLGYSVGLTNYIQQSNIKAYSNLLRLGISYRLK